MDRSAQNIDRSNDSEIMNLRRMKWLSSMDRSAQNIDRSNDSEIMNLRRMKLSEIMDDKELLLFDDEDEEMRSCSLNSMDRSAQNIDRSSDSEIMNLRRLKLCVFDVAPLEIIDDKELLFFDEDVEVFFHGVGAADVAAAAALVGVKMNINQINLVIHVVNHDVLFQYWSPKSEQQQQQQLNSSCHGDEHHRDHHHLREDDDDKEMIMITCQPSGPPRTTDIVLNHRGGGVYASAADNNDDYIMSLLRDLDILYEIEWIFKTEQLEEVKRCIIKRINESKPAVLLAKPKTVCIRLDLSSIMKKYYANPAAAAAAHAEDQLLDLEAAEDFALHFAAAAAPTTFYDDYDYKPSRTPLTTALRSSIEALETKILEQEDLISASCSVCLDMFCVGVDEIKKMPCSHIFHSDCLLNWLQERNTCPLCYYPLPTFVSRFLVDQYPLPTFPSRFPEDQLP